MRPDPRPPAGTALCRVEELGEIGSKAFAFGEFGNEYRLFVARRGGQLRAYLNVCPHAHHPLDWNDNVFNRERTRLLCGSHGAEFRFEDGVCEIGPCVGKALTPVAIAIVEGRVVLAS